MEIPKLIRYPTEPTTIHPSLLKDYIKPSPYGFNLQTDICISDPYDSASV